MKAVLEDGKKMSSNWSMKNSKPVDTTVVKVMDLAEGMGNYNLATNNCWDVSGIQYQPIFLKVFKYC